MILLRKYNTATHIYVPIIKRAVVDFAIGADWTPVAGDVKISKDGAAAANVTNLPTAITMGNTAVWDFSLTATELAAAKIIIMVADAATKAVEDQTILIDTYGNASAEHAIDLDDPVRAGLTALPNANAEAAGGLYTRGGGAGQINQPTNGQIDTNVAAWRGTQPAALTISGYVQSVLLRWLTDNGGGTPDALSSGKVAVDLKLWTATTPSLILADLVDQVWNEAQAGHIVAGTFGSYLDAAITSRASAVSIVGIPDAVLDTAVEGGLTWRQVVRIVLAAVAGKSNGFPAGPAHYRDNADTKDRITATVDADGNRSIITLDGT